MVSKPTTIDRWYPIQSTILADRKRKNKIRSKERKLNQLTSA